MMLRFAGWTCVVLISIAGAFVLADGPPAAAKPADKSAPTSSASPGAGDQAAGLLRVACPPESGLASPVLIQSLLQNPEFLAELIQGAKLTRSADGTLPVFSILETLSTAPTGDLQAGICELQIAVLSRDANLPPGKLLDVLPAALVKKLIELDQEYQPTRVRLQLVKLNIERVRNEVAKLSAEREASAKQLGYVPEIGAKLALELASQLSAAKVSAQAVQSRIEVLEQQMAEAAKLVESTSQADPALKELERSSELQLKKLELIREMGKSSSPSPEQTGKLLDAEMAVAMARADVAKYRRSLVDSAGGARLATLQQQLDAARVDRGEQQAREKWIGEEYSHNNPAEHLQLKQMRLEIEIREREFVELMEESLQLQKKLDLYRQPAAIVIRR